MVKLTSAPSNHPHPELFNVKEHLPTAIIDMRYATKNNFVGKKLYKDSNAYLRKETIEALKKVISELEPKGFRLIILDAYRPPSVQKALFESTKYKAFVAPPIPKYNRHGRGTAVDASLADLNGKPVEMPSKFDEFSKKADQDFSDVSKTAGKHARILIRAFHQAGFSGLRHEWWHFDLRGWQNFEIIEN
ncbi:MAG: M15 family metallopeptidase [Verrucomicrobiota bacterium]